MEDSIDSVATALGIFMFWIRKNSKLVFPLQKTSKQMFLVFLVGGIATFVGLQLEREAQARHRRSLIAAAVTEVYTDFWDNNSRHKKRKKEGDDNGETTKKKRRACRHNHKFQIIAFQ